MKMLRLATTGGMLLLASTAFADQIREGRWAYTMTMNMPDMPELKNMPKIDPSQLPPGLKLPQFTAEGMQMSFEQCVTKEDLVPRNQDDCKVTKMDRQGNTVKWAAVCNTPRGKMNSSGVATYTGDTMTSTAEISGTDERGKPINMTQKISGRYLGACTK